MTCYHKDQYNHDTGQWDKCSCKTMTTDQNARRTMTFDEWWKETKFSGDSNFMFEAWQASRQETLKEAAEIIDSECQRVLALQTNKGGSMEDAIDTNLRMMAILLPDLSDAIRKLFT